MRHGGGRVCGGDSKGKELETWWERHGGGRGCGGDSKSKELETW